MLNFEQKRRMTNKVSAQDHLIELVLSIQEVVGKCEIMDYAKEKLGFLATQPISTIYFDENSITIRNPLMEFKLSVFPNFSSFDTIETRERVLYKKNEECTIKSMSFNGDLKSIRESTITEEDGEIKYVNTEISEDRVYHLENLIYFNSRKSLQETSLNTQRKITEGLTSYSDGASIIKKIYTSVENNGSFSQSAKYKKAEFEGNMFLTDGIEIDADEFREALVDYKESIGSDKFEMVIKKIN